MGAFDKVRRNLREIGAASRSGPDDRRRIARRYVHDALRQAVPYTGVVSHDLIMFSATQDRTISRELYVSGWWDWDGLPDVLHRAGIDPVGSTIVEVGANIGTTTVQGAQMGARMIAFEPEPQNFRLLRANVAVNLFDSSVTCVAAGCSAENRTGRMELSAVNNGEHHVSEVGNVEIELVRLDDALAELGVEPQDVSLLWIDTEGHEVDVLAGATEVLAASPAILMEFWPKEIGDRLDELVMLTQGYSTIFDMRTAESTTIGRAARVHEHDLTDLLLLP